MTIDRGNVLRVVAAVILDGPLVLACRRNADRAAGGLWEFPGGKVEAGEAAEEALVREIREELETEIDIITPLTTDDTVVGDRVIRLECFTARLMGERPSGSSDHDALIWIAPSTLKTLDWARPDLPAVRLLVSGQF